LEVRGRPILDWTLGALPASVDRVLVVVHYLAEQVEKYLQSQTYFKDWLAVFQDQPRGTGDALLRCREHLRSHHFLVVNGDDLFGAGDLAALAKCPAGILVHIVDEPRKFGIVFQKPDGTLEKLVEKPALLGRRLANTGAYSFPHSVFDIELKLSPRGEYEITDYVTNLAARQPVQVVQAQFWLPIGTEEAWKNAEKENLEGMLIASRER
jgi:bifunctional UDP-N-acetylglucosamine pyrophosphorylase/glucosamine-1-phosphate N-acetyltransferase